MTPVADEGLRPGLPPGLLLAVYGDDFTGSAAVMEVLTFAGLPAVLFLDVPTEAQRARFPGLRAVVVAGVARTMTPDAMAEHLPPLFDGLAALGAPLMHYKICSTLDSSPRVGSIGRAIDIAVDRFRPPLVPLLVAAPALRRFQCFGHLFAAAPDGVYRLDRHPVMARHPVTPMAESDVARHLSAQTDLPVGTLDLEAQASDATADAGWTRAIASGIRVLCLDALDDRHLARSGRMIWQTRGPRAFCVGSQGVEYGLVAHWRDCGWLGAAAPVAGLGRARMAVISGSMSATTAAQIAWATRHGFAEIPVDPGALMRGGGPARGAEDSAVAAACRALDRGHDPILSSAGGGADGGGVAQVRPPAGLSAEAANARIGTALGRILSRIVTQTGIRRAVIAGGDTSGMATRALGAVALTALAPTLPGAAICRVHADAAGIDGLELALKGGQMGSVDYFGWVRDGGGDRPVAATHDRSC